MKKIHSLIAVLLLSLFACSKQDNDKSTLKSHPLSAKQDLLPGSCPLCLVLIQDVRHI